MITSARLVVGLPALLLLVWIPGHLEQFEAPKAHLLRTIGIAVVAFMACQRDKHRAWRGAPGLAGWADRIVVMGVAVEILGLVRSVDPVLAVFGEMRHKEGLLTTIGGCGLYFALRSGGLQACDRALRLALWASVPMCLFALVQAAGWDPLPWAGGSPVGSMGAWRPFSTMGHPNHLGVVVAGLSGAATVIWIGEPRTRWWSTPVVLLLYTTGFLAFSRAGWLGLGASIAVALAWTLLPRLRGRPPVRILGGLSGAVLLFAFVAFGSAGTDDHPDGRWQSHAELTRDSVDYTWIDVLLDRGAESARPQEGSARSRWEIWRSAVAMWRAHPWTGVGPDHFALHFPAHQTPEYWRYEWASIPVHAHSLPLHVLATRGSLGAIVLVVLVTVAVMMAFVSWRRSDRDGAQARSAAAATACGVGILVAALFGSPSIAGLALLVWATSTLASCPPSLEGASPMTEHAADAEDRSVDRAGRLRGAMIRALPALSVLVVLVPYAVSEVRSGREAARAVAWSDIDPARAFVLAEAAAERTPYDDHLHRVRTQAAIHAALRFEDRTRLATARRASEEWLRRSPHRALAHQRRGSIHAMEFAGGEQTAAAAAIARFEAALALAPQDGLVLAELARILHATGRTDDATRTLGRALTLYPESGLLWRESARLRILAGDHAGALGDLHRAEQFDPR